ncbi:MAG: hypothetical protein ACLQNE_29225 [Thermoguttaceae bacterium]
MRTIGWFLPAIGFLAVLAGLAAAAPATQYTLRYKFHPGETLRWEVTHESNIEATVSGTSQSADSQTTSVKVWRVKEVRPDGAAVFQYSVESVRMKQKLTGRMEVHYDSNVNKKPPLGFDMVAKSIGVPLVNITLDNRGKIVRREHLLERQHGEEGDVTLPLPEQPVALGASWTIPQEIEVAMDQGGIKRIKTRQVFTLEAVQEGIAAIRVEQQILSPIDDPSVEAKLIQRESTGTIRFAIDPGRVIGQAIEVDRRVLGFRGPASALHCRVVFNEKFLSAENVAVAEPAVPAPGAAETASAAAEIKIGSADAAPDASRTARRPSLLAPEPAPPATPEPTPAETGKH